MSLVASLVGYTATLPLLLTALLLVMAQYVFGRRRTLDGLIRPIAVALLATFGVRVRITDPHGIRARLTEGGGVLLMPNHVSILDPLVLFIAIRGPVRGVELEDHFHWPVWGPITRGMGSIPISHRNVPAALRSLDCAGALVRAGTSIVIFPEGHRTRDGRLQPFRRGSFRLAKAAEAPIVPVALRGLYRIKNITSPRVSPGVVEVVFGESIPASRVRQLSERELGAEVRDAVARLLEDRTGVP